ncbi:hypothetical protein PtrSN001A_005367 [Pyrenophora tritici-repentis]|nr:hypothetical protein PtrSN001A_005367 [Pyrenophora tritici-repentis]
MAVISGLKRAASEEPEHHGAVQQPMDMKRLKVPNATEPTTTTRKDSTTELENKRTEVAQGEQNEIAAQLEVADVPTTTKINSESADVQPEETSKAPDTEIGVPAGEHAVVHKVQSPNGGNNAPSEVHVEGTSGIDGIGAETAQPITDPIVISDDNSGEYTEDEDEEDELSEEEYDHEPYGSGPLEAALQAHEDEVMDAMTMDDVYDQMGLASDSNDSESEVDRKLAAREELENDDWNDDGDYGSDF